MGIRRTEMSFEGHYTTIPNAWLRDTRLSRRARGLLGELLSHRVGWHVSLASLRKHGPEGRDALRAAILELVDAGYLRRAQSHGADGRFNEIEYDLQDPAATLTVVGKSDTGGLSDVGLPDDGLSDVGKSDTKKPIEKKPISIETHLEGAQAPSPHCSKHPNGTDRPCRACGEARKAHDRWQIEQAEHDRLEASRRLIAQQDAWAANAAPMPEELRRALGGDAA